MGFVVAAATVALTGCGDSSDTAVEEMIEQQSGLDVEIDSDDGNMSIETEDGSMTVDEDGNLTVTGADGSLVMQNDGDGGVDIQGDDGRLSVGSGDGVPDEWPDDVPAPDGLSDSTSTVAEDANGTTILINGTADIPYAKQYADDVAAAGFTETYRGEAQGTLTVTLESDGWSLAILAGGDDGFTTVTLTPLTN